jgi:undecaprenyl-diphosphatase
VSHDPALSPLLVPLALAIAASRVVLGLHYPSDVVAGAAIGSVLAALTLGFWPI